MCLYLFIYPGCIHISMFVAFECCHHPYIINLTEYERAEVQAFSHASNQAVLLCSLTCMQNGVKKARNRLKRCATW